MSVYKYLLLNTCIENTFFCTVHSYYIHTPDNICSHTTEVVGAFIRDSHIHLMPWDLNTNTCNN